ncbi:phosphate-binding protein [Planctomycetales bacterium]|nr:phosphate-binding protein [Planctomycetales bacterium]
MCKLSAVKNLALALLCAVGLTNVRAAELPNYTPTAGLAGSLSSIGSDTLNNLMAFWAEAFRAQYPSVKVEIEGKGSATAPPALAEGVAQIGPMSRLMTPAEIDAFEKKNGFKPLAVAVAVDCVAIYVNKDNPLTGLSLAQADAIFSNTRKRETAEITNWGQLGLTGDWANRPISMYGRNSASGTYSFFKEHVLKKGDFKNTVKEQPGSAAIVNGIANDKAGIGYSGIGYKTSEVRVLPIAETADGKFVEPTFAGAINGEYPLGRLLYVYIPKKAGVPLPEVTREFIKFILSRDGQAIVDKDGYGALPNEMALQQLADIEE